MNCYIDYGLMCRLTVSLILMQAMLLAADAPADGGFLKWLDNIAQRQLDARDRTVAAITTPDAARERQQWVRAKVLTLIGGLPDYNGPLHARVTGIIEQPGFTIEKIIYESRPGLFVTANLYRPAAAGKYPGILLPLGHWDYGKPAVQRIAANLALKGFVVLAYDPIGQGERQQAWSPMLERSLVGGSTEQHFLAGAKRVLMGESFARDRVFDAKRSLDYLVSRADVDAQRIGVTGCSGGGTLTTFISALDPRVKVAAPACYITSFHELFSGSVGDSEQSIPGFIAAGLDEADFVESFAPKPWLIGSTRGDFFPIAGTKRAFDEARRWYGMFGAEDRIKWVVGEGGHGTPQNVREGIYAWMIRWLRDGKGDAREADIPLLPEWKLWVTETGQAPGKSIYDIIAGDFARAKQTGTAPELVSAIREWMREPDPPFRTAVRVISRPSNSPGVVLVDTADTPALEARAQALSNAGEIVAVIVPRGTPAGRPQALSGDWIDNTRAWLVGLNLPGLRALDIVHGIEALQHTPNIDTRHIRIEANGVTGIWALMAAAVSPQVESVTVRRMPSSIRSALASQPLARDLHDAAIPGFALKWDIDNLESALNGRKLEIVDPVDWMGVVQPLRGHEYVYTPADQ